jgi:hypothetical protein
VQEIALPVLEQLLVEWLLAQPCYLLFWLPAAAAARVAIKRPPGLALQLVRVLLATRTPASYRTSWGSSSRSPGTWRLTTATGAALTSYFVHEVEQLLVE